MARILFVIIFIIVGVSVTYYFLQPREETLPVINPIDLEKEMVEEDLLRVGYGHTIGDFTFLDQNGKPFSRKDVKGKVFVAEYFFTTCGTICPKMNAQMQRVQNVFKGNENVEILSFTVNPEVDTVAQMKNYAEGHGADAEQWHFLTGKKEELYTLARRSFFVLKPAEAQNLGDAGSDFIHTNNFVLVDKKGRIRGYYDGTSEKEVGVLLTDIQRLLDEKEH